MQVLAVTCLALLAAGAGAASTGDLTQTQVNARSFKLDDARSAYYTQQYRQQQQQGAGSVATAERRSYTTQGDGSAQESTQEVASARNGTARLFGALSGLSQNTQINPQNLLLIGCLVIGAIIFVPWILQSLSHHGGSGYSGSGTGYSSSGPSYSSYGRAENGADAASPTLLTMLDEALRKYDIDSSACVQRGVCSYVRQAARNVLEGRAESTDLILDGLATNSYVASWLDGSAVLEASNAGRSGVDCGATYPSCTLSPETVLRALTTSLGGDA